MLFLDTEIVLNDDILPIIGTILICGLVVALIYLFYFHIPITMAHNRGRNATLWVILCFIISPIWVYIILAIVGDSDEKRRQDIEKIIAEHEKKNSNDSDLTQK